MKIKEQYFDKYISQMAIDQICDDYKQKGYTVNREETLGKFHPDLVARKGSENIVVEVRTGKTTSERKKRFTELAKLVRSLGYKLVVVIATPREDNELEIENLKGLLFDSIQGNMPPELSRLSSHTRIKEIIDADISKMIISDNKIEVGGKGVLCVSMQFGSDLEDNDDDLDQENFSFEFDVTLGYDQQKKLRMESVERIKVDTDSYYI